MQCFALEFVHFRLPIALSSDSYGVGGLSRRLLNLGRFRTLAHLRNCSPPCGHRTRPRQSGCTSDSVGPEPRPPKGPLMEHLWSTIWRVVGGCRNTPVPHNEGISQYSYLYPHVHRTLPRLLSTRTAKYLSAVTIN